ncbi:phage tail protein [Lysobacter antibioticus]|uniref:phage tail protein n=1 Tax=Lysobacter TaxID=68 RepID=UPI0004D02EC5|nr:phage tail protein [Lysobacter antibioticus]
MNVNGARFQMLYGRDDWARCTTADFAEATFAESAATQPLAFWWEVFASPMPIPPATLPGWDPSRSEITLQPQAIELPATLGETPLSLDARRPAAADRHGNVYRVADDAASLRVASTEGGSEAPFWPADPADCAQTRRERRLAFETHQAAQAHAADRYLAVVVTEDDYLVAAFARGDLRGLMSFDLISGGPPLETSWPAAVPFEPFDLCPRHGGGAWVLDRVHRRLWELDCTLAVVNSGQTALPLSAAVVDDFQPHSGPLREQAAVQFPAGLDLAALSLPVLDPIAIESIGAGTVLLLDRDAPLQRSRVVRLRREGSAWSVDASQWLDALPALAHDMVYASGLGHTPASVAELAPPRLFIASEVGNQVHAFEVIDNDGQFALRAPAELYPLRRYGGRALVSVAGKAHYDCGPGLPRWTPVVQQHRQRYAAQAVFVTPVFDSNELGTVWDKLLLDAAIPPDTAITIESRAGDELSGWFDGESQPAADAQVIGSWLLEPVPRLRTSGPELPWLRREAARATRREAGAGTWELLLQQAHGRYLQLRVTLVGRNGTATPRLRALRVWSPRFSYPQRFLPALYREDSANGDFLERWLANCESTLTQIEDRVANVQSLFDARTVPQDALAWLAGWFDLALDPSWDERRHRLLVRHAMDFFRWRGTVHGLRVALTLAFEPGFDAAMFDGPDPDDEGAGRIRIVESYQTRLVETLIADAALGSAASDDGLRNVVMQSLWTPAEGNAGLVDRYAAWLQSTASALQQMTPFSLAPPPNTAAHPDAAQEWNAFCSAHLGFVPSVGAAERSRWQGFLMSRYGSLPALNLAHAGAYAQVSQILLPGTPSAREAASQDWQEFCARSDGARERKLWHDFLARRYRRIERLRSAHLAAWPEFEQVPLPDRLPASLAAQTDWLQFERQLLAMHRTAHRFSVLLPVASVIADPYLLDERLALARRIVELEKPAHTVFDVRFYWAFNRVGEARLGLDTQLGAGSRASELIPDAVVGRAYLGASFVGGAPRHQGRDRLSLEC